MEIQTKEIIGYIKELVHIPSPSGNTEAAIGYMKSFFDRNDVSFKTTNKGAVIATIKGEDDKKHRLLTAHVDTLGGMVKEIKSDGRLKIDLIGGFYWNTIEGEYCTIHSTNGKIYTGTVLMHQTAAHVYKGMNDLKRDEKNMEVRVDQEFHSRKDAEEAGISVGDFVSFAPRFEESESGFIKSRHLDDKASVAILMHIIKQIKQEGIKLPYTTHFLISNNEEIGYGGNSNIPNETVEYLAVDMGAIGDGQATDEFTVSICAKDSGGPYHFGLRKHLVDLAEKHDIGYKVDIYPYYGSDATAAIRAGADVVHGLIGPGIDASHAFERTHVKSLKHTADLIKAYLLSPLV
ncbi:M42 family metallopeptidase [Fictibacillus barbaricus]|uniref:M42 family metallopeptidase n=1 Tax=Fictibacillus barbaricus TaxID=182136 RepID=A0ABS2ZJN0_9BACL|nr:M42 family metallopeptidase [Fictibacillus barbaricus]MBN3547656.1 M42 family metallopeptidase [Fictibacillus barbaricus]GGB50550.1 putative aminopeptidase YhfE [Fictibacillus barbaricus]